MIRRAITLAAAIVALLMVLPATPASAHAFLSDSNPADGSSLATAPDALRLAFSESVVISATHIDVVDSDGTHYPVSNVHLVGAESGSTEDPVQVVATLPTLPHSAYRVSWQTLSSDDLHRTSGLLVFGIGRPVTAAGQREPAPRLDESSLRWLLFLCLSFSLGGLLAVRLLRRSGADDAAGRRCARLSAFGAAAGALCAVALLVDQYAASGSSVVNLLRGSYGARWLVREIGFGLLVAAALLAYRASRPKVVRIAVTVGGAACACIGSALLGHSGAGRAVASTRVAADGAHLAAAATWAGALLVLVAVGFPLWRKGKVPSDDVRAVLRRFGVYAAACVSIIVVTGVYLASDVVGSVDAALLTTYGRTLLIKVAVVTAAGGLGLLNHRRLRRRRPTGVPVRTVAAEAIAAALVLGLAALLTSGQPAREPQFVASPRPATVPVLTAAVDDLQQALAIRPNRPGRNVVTVSVFDTRRPAPAPIRRVVVSMIGLDGRRTGPLAAERLADGRWSVAGDVTSPGRLGVEVTVLRAGLPEATHLYRWTVGGTRSVTRPATVSTAPIGDRLRLLAILLAAMLALGWTAFVIRSRRAVSPPNGGPAARDGELVKAGAG
ncbi:MAG TPA: copper resistance protein CopC [Jatrophihabitantaceae bacterium]|jgi:copper transport protein